MDSTVMRVPAITGLPDMTVGSDVISSDILSSRCRASGSRDTNLSVKAPHFTVDSDVILPLNG